MPAKQVARESSLLRAVERILRKKKIVFRKRWGGAYGVAGDPDLYLVVDGRHAEIELKRPGENPTKAQLLRMVEWEGAGASVGVVHSVSELLDFLRTFAPLL
jgi:hypothetical protein